MKLQPLQKGDTWKLARTVRKVGDRSYLVQTETGKTYRRNRKFIRTVPETIGQPDGGIQSQLTAGVPILELGSDVQAGVKTRDLTPAEAEPPEPMMDPTPPITLPELSEDAPTKRTASGRVVKEPIKFRDYVRL